MRRFSRCSSPRARLGAGGVRTTMTTAARPTPRATSPRRRPTSGLMTPGVLTVASDIPYAPFEFTEPGLDRGHRLRRQPGEGDRRTPGIGITDVEFVKQPFDTIILSVTQGRFDMSASSFSITPERAKQVDFGDPYFSANQSILVQTDSTLTSLDDLQGKTIGAQRGTIGADLAATVQGAEVSRYEHRRRRLQRARRRAASTRRSTTSPSRVRGGPEARRLRDRGRGTGQPRELRPRVPEGEHRRCGTRSTQGLAEIKANGTYDEIYAKWFGEHRRPSGEDPSR